MNSLTIDPPGVADDARRPDAPRPRRIDSGRSDLDATARAGHGSAIRLMVVATLVSVISLGFVTALQDTAPLAAATAGATPQPATPSGLAGVDHDDIAPDAISVGDTQTVESSIAAYER